mmetsp:Transcript_28178/g.60026  ORF Transcript_28178/g.60026 Transcript_28178/m.60026 type:complete len:279 (+) Transcript_28178:240-1076(+)|eukprot:CAMPEP_0172304424 /NCGR_PEP_ID=MMETSP1058-20130122/5839_1 /TAXON_ID=83371 /ORGANISM="Detonula confervacea, Strain CCMP 353" /LENGTH=278 /DNA_ID=CAMNT_0013015649 /DNA_START=189 /DNA_END=1025 /DNA_ORIENTATION=+
MSDTRSQLEEIDALIADAPDDPSLLQLREDLMQLIELEEQESAEQAQPSVEATVVEAQPASHDVDSVAVTSETSEQNSSNYTAQGTFMEHIVSKEAVAEAPDLGSFQPVMYSSTAKSAAKSQPAVKSDDANDAEQASANLKDDSTSATTTTTTQPPEKKKKKKKKKSDDAVLDAKFELPSHLVPLESDTQAQKLKKHRTAKALKSKFRGKQKEAEHAKKQNDWQSFATKASGKRKKGVGSNSIFSTEEGVDAKVGVVSGGGSRKMTGFTDPNKRHKFA